MPPNFSTHIRRAAVIGAGTMGAAIAAQLVNAGVPTLLLDVPAAVGDPDRNAVARAGVDRARRARPAAFMDVEGAAAFLTIGNTADDLPKLAEVDWIVEAIIEKPEAKQQLWAEVERHAGAATLFSSNSSGIPMSVQSEGRSESFRRRFLGAHFYNPPRWLYLLELIPTADTSAEALETVRAFGDRVLGKGIVIANDVPGFIGNRVGIWSILHTIRAMEETGIMPAVVDDLTGPLLGRPKSATLRTADTVGIDVLGLISADLSRATADDFRLPAVVERLLERRWLGEKTGGGFYQRRKNADGSSTFLVLEPREMYYQESPPMLPVEVEPIAKLRTPIERTRALLALETTVGRFMRRIVYGMLQYAAKMQGIVANTHQDIDRAMRWGFGWEMGPFELMDALGLESVAAGIEQLGLEVPAFLAAHRKTGQPFYAPGAAEQGEDEFVNLPRLKLDASRTVCTNSDASLVDLGDGALLLEFHNKANSINANVYAMTDAALETVLKGFAGLVIGNQGRWFSAGADLAALLRDAEAGHRAAIQAMIDGFQRMTGSLRAAPFPVVAAPFGMTLGGGCETVLYSDAVQAHAELTTGLVEFNVGLMPSAGGTTEMLVRAIAALRPGEDPFLAVERTFALITARRVTTSALEARRFGFLRETDGITMNRRRLLGDAKAVLLALAPGYQIPVPRMIPVLGEAAFAQLARMTQQRREAGDWTEYDAFLAGMLARILSGGGAGVRAATVPVQTLLDLEREVFVELCARPETLARIRHILGTGKPLRN